MKHKLIIKIFIVSAICFLFSCSTKKKEKDIDSIGKYVYIDTQHKLHIKKKCVLGMKTTNETGNDYYKGIAFLDTANLEKNHILLLCNWCVEDEHYEQLKMIADRHEEIIDYIPETKEEMQTDEYWEQYRVE